MRLLALLLSLALPLAACTDPQAGHETGNALDPDGGADDGGQGGGEGIDGGLPGDGDGDGGDDGGANDGGDQGGDEGGDEGGPDPGDEGEGEGGGNDGGDAGAEGEGEAPDPAGEGEGEGEPPVQGGEGEGEAPVGGGEGEGEPPDPAGEGEGEPPPPRECREDGNCQPYFKHCDVCDWICVPEGVPVHDCRNMCPNEQDRGDPPQCKCDDGACQIARDAPPGPAECEEGRECVPFLDHCECEWTCRPADQQDDCDAECDIAVEQAPRPVCACSERGGCEMWRPRCSSDDHCQGEQRCFLSRICGRPADGQIRCGPFQGDGLCHAPCEQGECQGGDVCREVTIWHGDAGEIVSLCMPAPECGQGRDGGEIGRCEIGHRPGACCGCGQPMTSEEIDADRCVTRERDDPFPDRCQQPDCELVDCAFCAEPTRADCAGGRCVGYLPVRPPR